MTYSMLQWAGTGRLLAVAVVMAGLVGVSGCDEETSATTGVQCGNITCGTKQICCLDCDGRGMCGAPGSACPGQSCVIQVTVGDGSVDGGAADASTVGMQCVDRVCDPGQTCCIDCDGAGMCIAPGGECPGHACGCPTECGDYCDGAPAECPNPGCRCPQPNDQCPKDCGTWCGGQHPNCPDPGCECPTQCGGEGQLCCVADPGCNDGLTCCEGVPYHPTWGTCEKTCDMLSDRDLKTDIKPVDGDEVLSQLASLPVSTWRYLVEDEQVRHMGPMAQEFRAAFALGNSDRHIQLVDGLGVAIASIKALHRQVRALQQETAALRQGSRRLRVQLARAKKTEAK